MIAVIESGGKQHRVSPGYRISLERLNAQTGEEIDFDSVLLVQDNDQIEIGTPYVPNASVKARVLSHVRDPKVMVVKFKRRKNYLRRHGHRQHKTIVEILSINVGKDVKDGT